MAIQMAANPQKSTPAARKLEILLKDRTVITAAEMTVIMSGKPDSRPQPPSELPVQSGSPPEGNFTVDHLKGYLSTKVKMSQKAKPSVEDYFVRLRAQAQPGANWFTLAQLSNAEKFEYLVPATEAQKVELDKEWEAYSLLIKANNEVRKAEEAWRQGWQTPRIRRSWRDVLYDEDPSIEDHKVGKLGDQEGALFSYTRDGTAHTDLWAIHGALIVPFTINRHTGSPFSLRQFAFAPSVTMDKVTSDGDPKKEVDSILYRAGLYGDLYGTNNDPDDPSQTIFGYGLQWRAASVYATDWDHNSGLTGYEIDLEPRFHHGNAGIGYRSVLRKKNPRGEYTPTNSLLDAQFRVWGHLEGGEIQETGAAWSATGESFFRVGPTAQLTLAAPALSNGRTVSLTAVYSHLAAITGSNSHEDYFRASITYDLYRNLELNRKVGLTASYETGGLNFTKEEVDLFTVGLNVLF